MRVESVFLDNGGVITDNSVRRVQYRRLVAEFFVPKFGGSHEIWEQSNANAFQVAWQRQLTRVADWDPSSRSLVGELSRYYADWLRETCSRTGVVPPASDDECAELGRAADYWINPQIRARFAGVDDAILELARDHRLFIASDGFEHPLSDALGESARHFERLYGPEIVNVPKSVGRAYYDAIFEHAGIDRANALVVDDQVGNLIAANAAGVGHTVLVSRDLDAYDGTVIAHLGDLASIIETRARVNGN